MRSNLVGIFYTEFAKKVWQKKSRKKFVHTFRKKKYRLSEANRGIVFENKKMKNNFYTYNKFLIFYKFFFYNEISILKHIFRHQFYFPNINFDFIFYKNNIYIFTNFFLEYLNKNNIIVFEKIENTILTTPFKKVVDTKLWSSISLLNKYNLIFNFKMIKNIFFCFKKLNNIFIKLFIISKFKL